MIKDDVIVRFPQECRCRVRLPRVVDGGDHDLHPALLGVDHCFAQVVVAGDENGNGGGTITRQERQVAVYERIDALLPAPDEAAEAELTYGSSAIRK